MRQNHFPGPGLASLTRPLLRQRRPPWRGLGRFSPQKRSDHRQRRQRGTLSSNRCTGWFLEVNLFDVYRWLFVEPAAVCLGHGQEHLKILEDICHDTLIPASHASQCELSKFRTPPAMQRDFPIMPSVRTFLALNLFNRFRLSGAGLTFRHDTDDFVNGTACGAYEPFIERLACLQR